MLKKSLDFLLCTAVLLTPLSNANAEAITCPDFSNVAQVGACPTENELNYTYAAYCGDASKLYGKEAENCTSYENYRRLKNIALWESTDGNFSGYLPCDSDLATKDSATSVTPAPAKPSLLPARKPTRVTLDKQGKISRMKCSYSGGIVLTYRTRADCQVTGDGTCANGAPCAADCEKK